MPYRTSRRPRTVRLLGLRTHYEAFRELTEPHPRLAGAGSAARKPRTSPRNHMDSIRTIHYATARLSASESGTLPRRMGTVPQPLARAKLLALSGAGSGPPTSRSTILVPPNTGLSAFRCRSRGGREFLLTLSGRKGVADPQRFSMPAGQRRCPPAGQYRSPRASPDIAAPRPAPGASRESC